MQHTSVTITYSIYVLLYSLTVIPDIRLSKWNLYLSKNQEFTDIDSDDNMDLLQNKTGIQKV